jgi:hypothetical protein
LGVLVAALVWTGCGDDGTIDPEALRFGQVGSIEVHLEAPLRGEGSSLGAGQLAQTLVWRSGGSWTLHEEVSYRGVSGDETLQRSRGDPSQFAGAYASLITQLNEDDRLKLFIDSLRSDVDPPCGPVTSRITFTIRDDARGRDTTWVRCAEGTLGTLTPTGAGPGAAAARLVLATLLVREATVGERWTSAYLGTVPFGTLDRGEDSRTRITSPVTYIDARGFQAFWEEHAPSRPRPAVDFATDMVVVGVVGERKEAGDSVEVRRILRVDLGTMIEVVERVPGDFCSPAARTHVPYHIVVAPRTPIPHRFSDILVERVSCGG